MKIAINFGDNDFYSVWEGVLKVFYGSYKYAEGTRHQIDIHNKEKLAKIFSQLAPGIYALIQSGTISKPSIGYLTLKPEDIFINEEVDLLVESACLNRDISILDTNLDYPNNKCIYTI
jgi:hypothetical protein